MPNYDEIFKEIGNQIIDLAQKTVSNYKQVAIADAKALVAGMSEDLKKWTGLLASNDLDTEEFEILVNSEKDLVEMKALETAGLAAIRITQFVGSVLNMIVDVVLKAVVGNVIP